MTQAADPGFTLDETDPGDEVQRRFRYQHAYCAIQCVQLLAASPECTTVICENHEDVLLRLCSGKYVAVQIKTRAYDQPLFKASEEAVRKAIARFAKLDALFPNAFELFRFVTNFGFWKEEDNQHNLDYLVKQIQARGTLKGLRSECPLKAFVKTICAEYSVKEENTVNALLKLRLDAHEGGLDHAGQALWNILATHPELKTISGEKLLGVASALIFRVYEASSKSVGSDITKLYGVTIDFKTSYDQLLLDGKTLTAQMISDLITEFVSGEGTALLQFADPVSTEILLSGVDVMTQKMIRGGLQTERINKVKDYKASAETTYLRWKYKFELKEANQRLTHLKTIVEDDCIEAKFIAEQSNDMPYGPEIYVHLRDRLKQRVNASTPQTAQLFGFTEEHLLGVAGILTEECKVWWSEPFELTEQKNDSV